MNMTDYIKHGVTMELGFAREKMAKLQNNRVQPLTGVHWNTAHLSTAFQP